MSTDVRPLSFLPPFVPSFCSTLPILSHLILSHPSHLILSHLISSGIKLAGYLRLARLFFSSPVEVGAYRRVRVGGAGGGGVYIRIYITLFFDLI